MENQSNRQRDPQQNQNPQNPQNNNEQKIQQYEQIANHYTGAATALRNNDKDACDRCLEQARQAQQNEPQRNKQYDERQQQDPDAHM